MNSKLIQFCFVLFIIVLIINKNYGSDVLHCYHLTVFGKIEKQACSSANSYCSFTYYPVNNEIVDAGCTDNPNYCKSIAITTVKC
ncbi:hypothetical protein Mgra_00009431, partial [Meloidogyne graminicola]